MSKMVIIAGPQAAGKSTVLAKLHSQPHNVAALFPGKKAPLLFPLQESRQIIIHKYMLLGGIFMKLEQEQEVVNCDLGRMDLIIHDNRDSLVYIDECNIFTVAHAVAHGVTEIETYWDEYVSRLAKLHATVIFLNVPPDISWERRRRRYEERLVYFPQDQHQKILEQYYEYLQKLHPLLLDVFERLPFPKAIVDGRCSEENVMAMVCQHIQELTL